MTMAGLGTCWMTTMAPRTCCIMRRSCEIVLDDNGGCGSVLCGEAAM